MPPRDCKRVTSKAASPTMATHPVIGVIVMAETRVLDGFIVTTEASVSYGNPKHEQAPSTLYLIRYSIKQMSVRPNSVDTPVLTTCWTEVCRLQVKAARYLSYDPSGCDPTRCYVASAYTAPSTCQAAIRPSRAHRSYLYGMPCCHALERETRPTLNSRSRTLPADRARTQLRWRHRRLYLNGLARAFGQKASPGPPE